MVSSALQFSGGAASSVSIDLIYVNSERGRGKYVQGWSRVRHERGVEEAVRKQTQTVFLVVTSFLGATKPGNKILLTLYDEFCKTGSQLLEYHSHFSSWQLRNLRL